MSTGVGAGANWRLVSVPRAMVDFVGLGLERMSTAVAISSMRVLDDVQI